MPQVAPQQVWARGFNSTAINMTWNPIDQRREMIRGKLLGHRVSVLIYSLRRKLDNLTNKFSLPLTVEVLEEGKQRGRCNLLFVT
jgi:hypothetical protein